MLRTKRTIRAPADLSGIGLFTGVPCQVRLRPAPAGTGVVLVRTDLPNKPRIPVTPDTVVGKFRRTAVAAEGVEIESVEHFLSAIHGMGVGNLEVDVSAAEMPGLDGSSRPYVDAFKRAGLQDQEEERAVLRITDPVSIVDNEGSIVALPATTGLTVSYTLSYPGTPLGTQHLSMEITESSYSDQIAPARTFCLESEVEAFRQQNLGMGASYENTLIIGRDGPIGNRLRFPDEFVRHKILDLLGDLAALGASLQAHIVAIKTGHTTNMKLLRRLQTLRETGVAPDAPAALLDVNELLKILPHRYPMLLLDRVVEMEGYQRAVGIKNVTINEPFFQGHFPGRPIMPGVLIIEAMAQLAGALLMRKAENQAKIAVLLSLDGVKLRKTVMPGDQLRIEAETLKIKARTGEVQTRALVGNTVAAEAIMKFMLADKE